MKNITGMSQIMTINLIAAMSLIKFIKPVLISSAIAVLASAASAETVFVKYKGKVNLDSFSCRNTDSSLVHRICYDASQQYAVVNLKGTYYHYCAMPSGVVRNWLAASSIGKFYNANIKGNYDCRRN